MKMYLGNVPIESMNIHHFEMNTNSATVQASDMQAGVTAFARGQKITGTGKCFEFASYGRSMTNIPIVVPSTINAIQVGSTNYPIRTIISMRQTAFVDFSVSQTIAEVIIDGTSYPIIASIQNGMLTISCEHTIDIELFYGKDRYI